MMYYEKKVEWLKERYPEGTRICLDRMNDDPFPVESGTLGRVDHVDDIGTLHCVFDNGRMLGVLPGVKEAWPFFIAERNVVNDKIFRYLCRYRRISLRA